MDGRFFWVPRGWMKNERVIVDLLPWEFRCGGCMFGYGSARRPSQVENQIQVNQSDVRSDVRVSNVRKDKTLTRIQRITVRWVLYPYVIGYSRIVVWVISWVCRMSNSRMWRQRKTPTNYGDLRPPTHNTILRVYNKHTFGYDVDPYCCTISPMFLFRIAANIRSKYHGEIPGYEIDDKYFRHLV